MHKIDRDSKILNITHTDLDGVGCTILLNKVFSNVKYISVGYDQVDGAILNTNPEDYDYIFVTDISPKVKEVLEPFDNLIIIDHHQNIENDPKNKIYINHKYSGTFLVKFFLDKMYGKELLEDYIKFVTIVNDYDMWIHEHKGSHALNYIFGHLQFKKFMKRFADGKLYFNSAEKEFLKSRKSRFKTFWDEATIHECEKINACYVIDVGEFFNDVVDILLNEEKYDLVFISSTGKKMSIRTSLEDFNLGIFLKDLGLGGGHKQSAGIEAPTTEQCTENMDIIERELYKKLPNIRRS